MMLDINGNPVPVTVLDEHICRVIEWDEFPRLIEGGDLPPDFFTSYRDGDTVIWHTSPKGDWDALMGSEGYVLVRDDYIVKSVVVRMN
jgi:hypothetical protein